MKDKSIHTNKYIQVFIESYVKLFRKSNRDKYVITITGLNKFIDKDDDALKCLLVLLKKFDFVIELEGEKENLDVIDVICKNKTTKDNYNFKYNIQELSSIIELSSITDISIYSVLIIKIIAHLISKIKILYKAIVLDLDDTLWKGTISEDGIDMIKENMQSEQGFSFIYFMRYVRLLAKELGIYIAICSRNDSDIVLSAIQLLDENIFPIKNSIDFIVANNNDKSENIKNIVSELSILPESVVFVDDNEIVREEVKEKLPEVFVPEWNSHYELITQLIIGCFFDRYELSYNSQNRRKQFSIIKTEKKKNSLPSLLLSIKEDRNHEQAKKLYAKSNQFKLVQKNEFLEGSRSLYFELFRENKESLGICSVITYNLYENNIYILNWAISCRYFGIGLEEFILMYIHNIADEKTIYMNYEHLPTNQKTKELFDKYPTLISDNTNVGYHKLCINDILLNEMSKNTNLKKYNMDKKKIYTIGYTLFQNGMNIDIDKMFEELKKFGITHLVDVRSVPYSKQYPQCSFDNLKILGKNKGIQYIHMPEIGAKPNIDDIYTQASEIFFEDVFPISKSNRPEKNILNADEYIVDFNKFRNSEYFIDGLKRIENAYNKEYTLALMCSEKRPLDCHRYFLISKALENKFGERLEILHITKNHNNEISTMSNSEINKELSDLILNKSEIKELNILNLSILGSAIIDNYYGSNQQDKINDFCDRYWNLIHGWKKIENKNSNKECYD